jgi:hypothetical protein
VIRDKESVKITGAGFESHIQADLSESAIRIENCKNVIVRDMRVSAHAIGIKPDNTHLRGALQLSNCDRVEVQDVNARCGAGVTCAAACVAIVASDRRESKPFRSQVRVKGCQLVPGDNQIGLLITNAARTHVEDNVIGRGPGQTPTPTPWKKVMVDKGYRRRTARHLVAKPRKSTAGNLSITTLAGVSRFQTHPKIRTNLLAWMTPQFEQTELNARQIASKVTALWHDAIKGKNVPQWTKDWLDLLISNRPAVALHGIVIAGGAGHEVRILNNTVTDCRQCIRTALSVRNQRAVSDDATAVRSIGYVHIANNMAVPTVTLEGKKLDHYGIRVGSTDSVIVTDNTVSVDNRGFAREAHIFVDGIRFYGVYGNRVIAKHNLLQYVRVGIRFQAIGPKPPQQERLWLLSDNLAPEARRELIEV